MQYADFLRSAESRRRYWARSFHGWARIRDALPNAGHHALARLGERGTVTGVITQNVDGLHEAAGSGPVVALHGRLAEVVCLDCSATSSRAALQDRLGAMNPGVDVASVDIAAGQAELRPDGDVVVDDWQDFSVPECLRCGGVLKPDVVFFGESVPRPRVERCFAMVEDADALLVLGSSLTVMSGLRFVRAAAKRGIPVTIVNRGATRGDGLATVRTEQGCSEFLAGWEHALVR